MSNPFSLESSTAAWTARTTSRDLHVGIIGLGYVGLPLALLFAEKGIRVTGFDVDTAKVAALNASRSYIQRILPAEIAAARRNGFTATEDITALRNCDAILLCVPTPLALDRTPDVSYITSTVAALAPHTRSGQLIILESTTYPGTTAEVVVPMLEQLGTCPVQGSATTPQSPGNQLLVAFSPEREDPGNTTTPRHAIPKVIGGMSPQAAQAAVALYGTIFDRTVVVSSTQAAEMTKLLENIYRGVNIALVNELKQLCLAMGIDIWEVIEAAKTKPFGFQAFYPGPGIGGHCIPVDPFYLSWRAKQFGQPTRFIELAGEVNQSMPSFVAQTIERALQRASKPLHGSRVLLLGIAYKRDIDDLRESPALTLFDLLQRAGADVRYNDPYFPEVAAGRHYAIHQRSTPLDQAADFDCVVLVTDHSAYDIPALVAASPIFLDTRNATRGLTHSNIVRC